MTRGEHMQIREKDNGMQMPDSYVGADHILNFRAGRKELKRSSRSCQLAERLSMDKHTDCWAMPPTLRTRFKTPFSPPIPTWTSSEVSHRFPLG
jgi:hypothetical protein